MFSVAELFKVGRGPSSSHTIGPMRACRYILDHYEKQGINNIKIILYGSFALTGRGHLTDRAIDEVFAKYPHEIIWNIKDTTPHPNTMDVIVYGKNKQVIAERRFVSIGGGTICVAGDPPLRNVYPFKNFAEIKAYMKKNRLTPFQFLCKFEKKEDLSKLYDSMITSFEQTIKEGLSKSGLIDGLVAFNRRAKIVFNSVKKTDSEIERRIKLVSSYAMATNEEAVSYGMVITVPTCGSAGVMPAVFKYTKDLYKPTKMQIYEAFSAAALVGITIKQNGSVAGATGGCQAEVGVATALTAAMYSVLVYHAEIDEIEKSAEAALQQLLGLTCDAVGQCAYVPCIQRNAVFALRAMDAAELAHNMRKEEQLVHLDDTIALAYESGNELNDGYRETSKLGLAKYAKYTLNFRKNIDVEK